MRSKSLQGSSVADPFLAGLIGATMAVWLCDHLSRLLVIPAAHILACRAVGIQEPPYTLGSIWSAAKRLPQNWGEILFVSASVGILSLVASAKPESKLHPSQWPLVLGMVVLTATLFHQGQLSFVNRAPGWGFYAIGAIGTAISVFGTVFAAWFASKGLSRLFQGGKS